MPVPQSEAWDIILKSPTMVDQIWKIYNLGDFDIQCGSAPLTFRAPDNRVTVQCGYGNITAQQLAHELGHASNPKPPIDRSSPEACLVSTLADEGQAVLANVRAQREIVANGGPDIGINGLPSGFGAEVNAIYDAYNTGKQTHLDAARAIGKIWLDHASVTSTKTYRQYYSPSCGA